MGISDKSRLVRMWASVPELTAKPQHNNYEAKSIMPEPRSIAGQRLPRIIFLTSALALPQVTAYHLSFRIVTGGIGEGGAKLN
jgi:hypothetical protein